MALSAVAGGVRIRPVETADAREAFIRLPWRLYRDDPTWVPPLMRDVRHMLDPDHHPFHAHSDVRLFLALRGGVPVGRIAAIHNRNHVEFHGESVGFFGFFETENDPEVARGLLDAAGAWLADRDLRGMRGPASFSTNEEAGLLVEGFERPPMIMMPYNPPFYADLLREQGFGKAKDLLAFYRDDNRPPEYLERASRLVRKRYDVSVRPLRMEDFERELRVIEEIYNSAWSKNWGFVPMTRSEFRYLARELKPVLNPELALIVEDGDGRPVGFSLALPDFNEALRHADGRLFPLGLPKILWHARGIDTIRVITLGLTEEYRGKGIDALLYLETFRRGAEEGVRAGEFSWILEDNEPMCRALERMGARVHKRYRLYDRPLDQSGARPAA